MKEQAVKELSQKLDAIFHKTEEVEFAYLFGSFARGDEFSFSDIDIAVYLSEEASLNDELRLYSIIGRGLKRDIEKLPRISYFLTDVFAFDRLKAEDNMCWR